MISILLTVHNQEEIIQRVLDSIYNNASELVTQIIILLDGCTDNSEEIVNKYDATIYTDIYKLDNVFETRANNFGLKLIDNPYVIITQDDCLIKEKKFDKHLLLPMKMWKDVFAVSGRNAHNIYVTPDGIDYSNVTGWGTDLNDTGTFYLRQVVNRGPLLLDMNVVRQLNYFDEAFVPQNGDDHDLCLRAYREGFICGNRPMSFISERHWGGTRKGDGTWIAKAIEKNMKIIRNRHYDLISKPYPNEERCI